MVTKVIGVPMVNAGSLYVNGLQMTWVDGTHITVGAGAARDGTNITDIVVPATLTLNTAVQGANGLDIGAMANNTFYAVYVIGSSLSNTPPVETDVQVSTMAAGTTILNGTVIAEGTVAQSVGTVSNNPPPALIISTNFSQPNLPQGYDMSRRIGFVKTDGAAALLAFWQVGNTQSKIMYYDVGIQVLNAGASAAYAPVSLATAVPATVANGARAEVIFDAILTPTAAADKVNLRPTGSASVNGITIMSGDVGGVAHEDTLWTAAAISAGNLSVDYKVVGTVTLNVMGYMDQL